MFPPMGSLEGSESKRPMHRPRYSGEMPEKPLTWEGLDEILAKADEMRSELPTDRYYLKAMNCPIITSSMRHSA
jgi:hypothetical protein